MLHYLKQARHSKLIHLKWVYFAGTPGSKGERGDKGERGLLGFPGGKGEVGKNKTKLSLQTQL